MNVTILGCGVMGRALALCLAPHHTVTVFDRNAAKREALAQECSALASSSLQESLRDAEALFLSIKPKDLPYLAETLAPFLCKKTRILSILGGTSYETIHTFFPENTLFCFMPNLALALGKSIHPCLLREEYTEEMRHWLEKILHPLGTSVWVGEDAFHAAASLGGCGPAFFMAFYEASVEAGIAMGLSAPQAQKFSQGMIEGSLALLQSSSKHPAEWRWEVCSPKGMTIAGLQAFAEYGGKAAILNTYLAAYQRSITMSEKNPK